MVMTARDEITRIVMQGFTDPRIEIEQPVSMCPDDDPVGEPRPMEKVWATNVTPTIDRLMLWLDGRDAGIREDLIDKVVTSLFDQGWDVVTSGDGSSEFHIMVMNPDIPTPDPDTTEHQPKPRGLSANERLAVDAWKATLAKAADN